MLKYFGYFGSFIEIFQHNQQHDTLLPIIPCRHKLKAGIAYFALFHFSLEKKKEKLTISYMK
jgi:hypothetical protein